jgi:hypothetical protein
LTTIFSRHLRRRANGRLSKFFLTLAFSGAISPHAGAAEFERVFRMAGEFARSVPAVSRIVGGDDANPADWPSYALVRAQTADGKSLYCGGTFIARRWVLTAGHCVDGRRAEEFFVEEKTSANGRTLSVDRVVLNRDYTAAPAPMNDIALLHLTSAASSPPQALMDGALEAGGLNPGDRVRIAGFGLTCRVGVGITPPRLSQNRTCGPASGSLNR